MMLLAICVGAFISHFTAGVVNVALPGLTTVFQSGIGTVQWITTGYLLTIAVMLPLMGKLSDKFGQRTIHNAGYVLFTITSVLVAFSPNLTILLVLRVLQGIGASMYQATNIALITIHLPKEQRGRGLGILSSSVALGGMSGPIAGGFIAEWLSWQWLFLIHVPIIFIATILAFRYIPTKQVSKKQTSFDSIGAFLFAALIALVIFGVSNGNTYGWFSTEIILIFAAAIISLIVLLFWESKHQAPFLPLKVFQIPAISSGLIISCSSFLIANTFLVVMPFYLLGIAEVSPSTVGYLMIAYPFTLAFIGPLAGNLSDKYGSTLFTLVGLGSMGLGSLLLLLFLEQISIIGVVAVLALVGMGMGFIASPNNSLIMSNVPAQYVGTIGGMIALTRNAGMVFGAALGLGLINTGGNTGVLPDLSTFSIIFGINIGICVLSIFSLVYTVRSKKEKEKEVVK